MRKNKRKSPKNKKLYLLPRILAISFIVFISIFSLDVVDKPQWFLALFIHLIPSFILTIFTIIAWKHELIGGIIFFISGIIALAFFHSIIIALPILITGILFLMGNSKKSFQIRGK